MILLLICLGLSSAAMAVSMSRDALPLASGAGAGAVVERLAARQQQLAAEREQRQAQLQAESDTREDVSSFLSSYKADYAKLQQRCGNLQAAAAAAAASTAAARQDGAAKAALLEQLEALSVDVSEKEQTVSAASYFLPPYELRSCANQLQQLRLQLAESKQQLQPKRKFAFSKAVARTTISSTAAAAAASASTQQHAGCAGADKAVNAFGTSTSVQPAAAACTQLTPHSGSNSSSPAAAAAAPPAPEQASTAAPPAPSMQDQQLIAAGHGLAGLTGQLLVPSAQQLSGQGFVLHDLSGCDVFLLGRLSALRLQHLRDCRVYTGPVVGATFVDGCSSCTLMLASYQVRIHNTQDCQFYLRVRSRPIIEHSSNLGFAPYAAETLLSQQQPLVAAAATAAAPETPQDHHHQQQQQQQQFTAPQAWQPAELLVGAQLLDDSGLWEQIDDFGWVKASASPHWRVLPEGDRQPVPQQRPSGATACHHQQRQ